MSEKVKDPVCGMTFPQEGKPFTVHNGKTYYFCCDHCRKAFETAPERYLESTPPPAAPVAADSAPAGSYLCPMHPEVVSDHPGECPKCGMDLVPSGDGEATHGCCGAASAEAGAAAALRGKFCAALVLTLLLMASMHFTHILGHTAANLIQATAATLVIFGPAFFLLRRGFASFHGWNLNMFTLITIGILWAYGYSLYALSFPGTLPPAMLGEDGTAQLFFEPAAMIACLILLGQFLEARAQSRSADAIRSLLNLLPPQTIRLDETGTARSVPVAEVKPGDTLRIRPGDRIPVDGVLLSGSGNLDESMLTGESVPAAKKVGAAVSAGTVNLDGSFDMTALKIGKDTMLAAIVELVKTARRSQSPIQRTVDRISAWFVPTVILCAAMAFCVWTFLLRDPQFGTVTAIAVLLVACPCALGLATPMSITVGVGMAATQGIVVRDFSALEKLKKADVIVLDKTGTLTAGKPELSKIYAVKTEDEKKVLRIAAALEKKSAHPLSGAVIRAAAKQDIATGEVTDFRSFPGLGVSGVIGGAEVLAGSLKFFRERGIDAAFSEEAMRKDDYPVAGSGILIAENGHLLGLLAISDALKSDAPYRVGELRKAGFELVLLTGDNRRVADAVASALQIERVIADASVQEKFTVVKQLQSEGRTVVMVGDGINDAAALTQADVGIAMGGGADIAMQSAGITLLSGSLENILRAYRLSREVGRNIAENLFLAFAYNIVMIPFAAGVFYAWTHWLLSPVWSSLAMSCSSIAVILNSFRLRAKLRR